MVRPTFMGFETCKRGIAVNQKSMDIIGNNVMNWDTVGYTRQRVDLVSVANNTRATRYGTSKASLAGQGVDMLGISQVRDPYLDKRFRDEYADSSYFAQSTELLTELQSALREFGPEGKAEGLTTAINNLVDALTNAQQDSADDFPSANLVATSMKNMTQLLHELSSKLDGVETQAKYDMSTAVDDFNNYVQKIAELNKTIRDDLKAMGPDPYYGPNELLDERNLMLDELSKYGNIDVQAQEDGTVTVRMNEHMLIDGGPDKKITYDTIRMTEDTNGTVAIRWNSSAKDATPATGMLKAYTDYINGNGPNMSKTGETLERGIRYYREKLDTFARTLATTFNQIVPISAAEEDGMVVPTVDHKPLFGARVQDLDAAGNPIIGEYHTTVDVPITAANISLSDELVADSNYLVYADGVDNRTYYQQMVEFLNGTGVTGFTAAGEKFEGNFYDYVIDYSTTLSTDVNFNAGRQSATATIANDLLDRRDEVSGVNKDEETQSMMVYNRAFQAIARVLTTMDEALDVLINNTGLVGR